MKLNKLYILLTVLALGILGSSIFLNFRLYNLALKYYLELNETRLDPLGLGYHSVESNQNDRANSDQIRVVFFGDSRASSWPSPDLDGYEFINRGINSQTSVQTIDRFKDHLRPLQPDVVVVQVGINDLKTIPLFPRRRESIVTNCQANIERIVKESKTLGAEVIVSTIIPAGEVPLERKPIWSDDVNQAVAEVNTYISTLAGEKIIKFDAFSIIANEQGVMRHDYSKDELHLNELGYKILNQEFVQLLKSVKKKN